MSKSQEVERVSAGAVEVIEEPVDLSSEVELIARVLAGVSEYEPVEADSSAINEQIVRRMLGAETLDELWKEPTTWSSKDCVGRVFVFTGPGQIWPSKFAGENGRKGSFLSVGAADADTGEQGIFNTSSPYIGAVLAWYARNGKLPVTLRVTKRAESSKGRPVLGVEPV